MDAAIKKELQQQTQDKITQVKKELAWEQEKCRLALDKLRSRYIVGGNFLYHDLTKLKLMQQAT